MPHDTSLHAAHRLSLYVLGRALALLLACYLPLIANALPSFARQTGQNCMACHAGGQFPELTPFGRMFKLTGYTIGERVVPLSVMGLTSLARVADTAKSDSPDADFSKNGKVLPLSTASVFVAGKVTDNIGAFIQMTADPYASLDSNGVYHTHSKADNMDLRIADRLIYGQKEFIYGLSLNNNPSISDPWNSAAAWMQYVPTASPSSHQFVDGTAPYPGFGAGGNIAGFNAYMFWNRTVYAELGAYMSANRLMPFMSSGIDRAERTQLKRSMNPYWRLAHSQEWGPHNLMIGTSGMIAHVFDTGSDTSDPNNLNHFRNTGIDGQYQYLLDPHSVTVQFAYMRQVQQYSANTLAGAASAFVLADGITAVAGPNAVDTSTSFRAKASYVYKARYGGSLALFGRTGNPNTLNQSSGYDAACGAPAGICNTSSVRVSGNLTGSPAVRGMTYEAFIMPIQNVRVGAQYTAYSLFNGAATNYDGFGRNAKDNNTLFLYAWYAY